MKKLAVLILLFFTCISIVEAQRWRLQRYRLYMGVGTSNYFGDIGGAAGVKNYFGLGDVAANTTHSTYHLGMLYKLQENIDVKLNINHAVLQGSDEGSKNEARGLSFETSVWEVSGQLHYVFYAGLASRTSGVFARQGMGIGSRLHSYVFAGAGATHYKASLGPQDVIDTRIASGRTGETDRQGGLTAVIPAGLGASYVMGNFWEVGLEVGGRYTYSNYLDGFASYYGNNNDIYYFTTFNVIRRIRSDRRGVPQFELFRKY